MGATSNRRRRARAAAAPLAAPAADRQLPQVGSRQPCPCGSGRRYKACHGRPTAHPASPGRPFAGLATECDWVALREIVPAATAPLTLTGQYAGRAAILATVLPMAAAGLVGADGTVLVGLQVPTGSGEPGRDAAAALERVLAAEPGTVVTATAAPGTGPRLADLVDPAAPLAVSVHDSVDFWLAGVSDPSPEVVASMERANQAVLPTARLAGVAAAYWCRIRDRPHLRWVLPDDEDALLDALARLHARDADTVGAGSRYVGSFRAHGLVVPVWELAPDTSAAALEEPAQAFEARLSEALADPAPLSGAARRARDGLRSRQVTLR